MSEDENDRLPAAREPDSVALEGLPGSQSFESAVLSRNENRQKRALAVALIDLIQRCQESKKPALDTELRAIVELKKLVLVGESKRMQRERISELAHVDRRLRAARQQREAQYGTTPRNGDTPDPDAYHS